MSFTLSTVPLTLLALYLAHRAKWSLIPVAMFMSVFQAASVLNIGSSIGVGMSYLLLLGGLIKSFRQSKPPLNNTGQTLPKSLLTAFVAYSVLSAFIFPFVFQGTLFTNPKQGFQVPLHWETGHLNQLFYLVLVAALFFTASSRIPLQEIQRCLDWYIAGNCLASIIALFQFACLKTGAPFPAQFLHTNPVYATFDAYEVGGFARINSTFVEASAAGGSFTPALAILSWRLLDRPTWKDARNAALIFIGLFLTISTSGYLCFAFLAFISALVFFFKWAPVGNRRAAKLAIGSAVLLVLLGSAALPATRQSIAELLNIVIFTKKQSFSYEQRTEMNNDAWKTAGDTYWLGAGFGVCRGSSVLPTLAGNVGVPGLCLFFGFIFLLLKPAWRARRKSLAFLGQAQFAVAVAVCGLLVAGSEITTPQLWLFLAACSRTRPDKLRWRIVPQPQLPASAETPFAAAL